MLVIPRYYMEIILNQKPPFYDKIIAAGMKPSETVVYTYGSKLYNPSNAFIREDIKQHEMIHEEQQGDEPDAWWDAYLADPEFRVAQELEAYAKQFAYLCITTTDREAQHKILMELAYHLSGPIYGRAISHQEAYKKIKEKFKEKFKEKSKI